jgi:ornithine cyclodeaminase/alanine dehydrogenase-like protein (mu-crystallin family)
MLYLNRAEVGGLLTHEKCFEYCEEILTAQATGEAEEVPRFRFTVDSSWLSMMPSVWKPKKLVGLRVYGAGKPGDPVRYMYHLFDMQTSDHIAMLDAIPIRDVRTGVIAAMGSKYLARPESETVGIIGSGAVCRHTLLAHSEIFNLKRGKVYGRNKEHSQDFAKEMGEMLHMEIEPVDTSEQAVRDVDIVITGTNNRGGEPLVRGEWLSPGTCVSSPGSTAGELDDEVITRASKIAIDSKPQFQHRDGDVSGQVRKGLISWDAVDEIHELVAGQKRGRENADEITVIKTEGTPIQDLGSAVRIYELALERGVGRSLGEELFELASGWYWTPQKDDRTKPPEY